VDWASAFAFLLSVASPEMITAARQLWQSEGRDPDEFDEAVAAAQKSRAGTIAAQRAKELAILNGGQSER